MRGKSHSFVIRIWYEVVDKEGELRAWRGSIDHVGLNKRFYFHTLSELTRFIREQAGLSRIVANNSSRPSWWAWLKRRISSD